MNRTENTERPKLKLNLAAKPLILNTNANPNVVGSALKKVVVFEKPKSDVKDTTNSPATSDNNNVATAAILDRLLHHSTILNIKGDSFRLKDNKKAGLVPIEIINKQEDNFMT